MQAPGDWIGRIRGSSLALVVADREADTWVSLRSWPLPSRPHSPVLRHTAQELGRMGAAKQLEG